MRLQILQGTRITLGGMSGKRDQSRSLVRGSSEGQQRVTVALPLSEQGGPTTSTSSPVWSSCPAVLSLDPAAPRRTSLFFGASGGPACAELAAPQHRLTMEVTVQREGWGKGEHAPWKCFQYPCWKSYYFRVA